MKNGPNRKSRLTILGAGIAGLSAGYYARKAGLPFEILEAESEIGGNCRTIRYRDFSFDSGAHRFHDKIPSQTREIKSLLGDDLTRISAPSRIYYDGVYIRFPLSLIDLVRKMGPRFILSSAFEVLKGRLAPRVREPNLEEFAFRAYGKTAAELFLLGYSRKLWGLPAGRLSSAVSGGRLKGLNLETFLYETFGKAETGSRHLDGSFYYPRPGIQAIPGALGNSCGRENIRTGTGITRIVHGSGSIRAVEVNGTERREVERVISTLPLTVFLNLLDPPPPPEISGLAGRLRFRDLVLGVLLLNRPSVSENASLYFPDGRYPFSRVYEPRNRSRSMSPPGKTALAAEYPCSRNDSVSRASDAEILERTRAALVSIGLIRPADIEGGIVHRMNHAYPVIERGTETAVRPILQYLEGFENLRLSGRGARFEYVHIHDLMLRGRTVIEGWRRA